MRHLAKNFSSTLVSIVVLLISGFTFAQDQSKGGQTSRIKQDVAVSVPDLSDIIPEAAPERMAAYLECKQEFGFQLQDWFTMS